MNGTFASHEIQPTRMSTMSQDLANTKLFEHQAQEQQTGLVEEFMDFLLHNGGSPPSYLSCLSSEC